MPSSIRGVIPQPMINISDGDKVWAFNNNFHEFKADGALYCEIIVGAIDGVQQTYVQGQSWLYVLQPYGGAFTFNTKDFASDLFEFKDAFDYTASSIDVNQSKTILFNIRKIMPDTSEVLSTVEFTFFNGKSNRQDIPFVTDGVVSLSELPTPYFNGYPMEQSVVIGTRVERSLVDNGDGVTITPNGVRDIQKECDGIYLKWHNGEGGYSYFLFERIAYESVKPKSYGTIREPLSWTDNTLEIGKRGQRVLDIFAVIAYEDRELMYSLAFSNEVYLYTGERYQQADDTMWLPVRIDMGVKEGNRDATFAQNVRVILPEEQTRTRI